MTVPTPSVTYHHKLTDFQQREIVLPSSGKQMSESKVSVGAHSFLNM